MQIHLDGDLPLHIVERREPIRLSYHGRRHYNSVVSPDSPLPLPTLRSNDIRQHRRTAQVAAPELRVSTSEGGERVFRVSSNKK